MPGRARRRLRVEPPLARFRRRSVKAPAPAGAGSIARPPLPPGNHCKHESFFVHETRDHYPKDVRDDERHRDIRHQAVQFADRAFSFPASPLRKASVFGFIAVWIGVRHHDRSQRSLALFSVGHQSRRHGCGEADQ